MNLKKDKKSLALYAVLAVVVVGLPLVVRNEYWTVVFVRVMINVVVILGLNFITGLIGQMNLGTAGIYALGAYSSALLNHYTGVSPWIGLLFAVVIGLLIGLVLGYPSLRLKGVYFSLTTIGFTMVVQIFLNNMTSFTGGAQGVQHIEPFSLFGFSFNTYLRSYYLYLVFALIALFVANRIVNSKWGRLYRSLRDNSDAVEMMGVNIADVKIKAFMVCAVFGTIGGAMFAHFYGYISPATYTTDVSMNYVLMLLVGGIGSVPGALCGAAIITMLPEALRGLGDYYLITFYTIIFIGILAFPNGWIDAGQRLIARIRGTSEKKPGTGDGEAKGGEA